MKRLTALLALVAALLCLPSVARAEDAPPPDKPAQQQQSPDKPAQGQGEVAPKARRDEEDEAQERAGRIDKMASYFRSKGGLADSVAAATARAEKAETELTSAREQLSALTKENATLKADWKALEEAALAPADSKSEASQKAAAAINAQVGKELRSIGHVPKPKAAAADTKSPDAKDRPLSALQLIALGRQRAQHN